jgi:hypothetical protein
VTRRLIAGNVGLHAGNDAGRAALLARGNACGPTGIETALIRARTREKVERARKTGIIRPGVEATAVGATRVDESRGCFAAAAAGLRPGESEIQIELVGRLSRLLCG